MIQNEQPDDDRLAALAELQEVLDAQGVEMICGPVASETVSANAIRAITDSIRSLVEAPPH